MNERTCHYIYNVLQKNWYVRPIWKTYRWGTPQQLPLKSKKTIKKNQTKPPSVLREKQIHNKWHLRWEAKIKCHDVPHSQKKYLISFNCVIFFHPDENIHRLEHKISDTLCDQQFFLPPLRKEHNRTQPHTSQYPCIWTLYGRLHLYVCMWLDQGFEVWRAQLLCSPTLRYFASIHCIFIYSR